MSPRFVYGVFLGLLQDTGTPTADAQDITLNHMCCCCRYCRCCSALVLRPWFAADVCNSSALLARLCRTDSESGQQACEWRHSTVMALWATVQYVLALPDDAGEARYKQQLPAAQQQLVAAVRGGPYGVSGGRATQQSHFVATVPR
jgi:hypothetical protein